MATTYTFKAMDLAGVPAQGVVEAESKQDVANQLKERGLVVIDIAAKYRSKELNVELFARVKAKDLAVASRQLATMVTSGMPILRALYVLEQQTESKILAGTLAEVRKDVEAGLLLSDSLARHPKVFGPLYVSMVRAGETGGVLEECLLRVADQLEKDAALRRQVRSAMVYPALVITFAVGVLLALVAFLIPVFEGVFKQFGGKLPALTQIMVDMSHLVTKQWYLLIVIVGVGVGTFLWIRKSKWARPHWDAFKLRIPMKIGDVVQKVAIARWSRTLVVADRRRRADPAGDRDHRQDRRQRGHRALDGGGDHLGQGRWHDRRAAEERQGVPADGRPDGRRRRGDGRR